MQGLTGREGSFHAQQMIRVRHEGRCAASRRAKGGTKHLDVPVFDTVADAVRQTGANASVIFVPPPYAADAILEAFDAELPLVDLHHRRHSHARHGARGGRAEESKTRLIGPNCPGIISPGKCKIGIMPGSIHKQGNVGLVSRSGTLTYEAVDQLTRLGIGQSTCIGIGGDPIIGTTFLDAIKLFNDDPDTHAIVMIGEIGGNAEEIAAEYIKKNVKKPVVGFIAGQTAPPGRRMGHAGAIISGGQGTAADKYKAMRAAGIHTVQSPADIGETLAAALGKSNANRTMVMPKPKKSVAAKVKSKAKPKPETLTKAANRTAAASRGISQTNSNYGEKLTWQSNARSQSSSPTRWTRSRRRHLSRIHAAKFHIVAIKSLRLTRRRPKASTPCTASALFSATSPSS